MPTSLEALVIFAALIAPGLMFEVGAEKKAPYLRTDLGERLFRFIATSVLFHAVLAPVTYSVWRSVGWPPSDNWRTASAA